MIDVVRRIFINERNFANVVSLTSYIIDELKILYNVYFFVIISPLLLVLFSVSAIVLLVLGNWVLSIIFFGIIAFVNWQTEAFALNFIKGVLTKPKNIRIRILTYNLNRAYTTSINKGYEKEVADFIKVQDADIVLLQEFNPLIYNQIDKLLRGSYPFGSNDSDESRFKSVYSRYAIEEYKQLKIESDILPICSMKIRVDGAKILVFNCHLKSNEFSTIYRELKRSNYGILTGIKKMVTSIQLGYKIRQVQAGVLLNEIRTNEYPVLICGDLNDVCGSKVLQSFKNAGFNDSWWRLGRGFGFTYWGMNMRFRLDHVLYRGKHLFPYSIKVIHSDLSDHRPIITTFCIDNSSVDN